MMNDPYLEFNVYVCIFCFGVCFNALLINCIWCLLGWFFFFFFFQKRTIWTKIWT